MTRGGSARWKQLGDEQAEQYRKIRSALGDEDYRFLLQIVPEPSRGNSPCYCRMTGCFQVKGIVPPGDFMLSLERGYDKNGTLARTPERTANQLRRELKGLRGRRGLGQEGQEWFCLNCVEALFHRLNDNVGQNDAIGYDPRFQALYAIANWILADERTCNDYPGCFSPDVPYRYGLELWKAVKLEDQSRLDGGTLMLHCPETAQIQPCGLFLGEDGESRYLYEEARDLDYTFPNGVSIKTVMRAADVRGKLLREVLGFARDLIARKGTVAPTPTRQNRHHIGGASLSDYTVAELAIWNSPDNELNPMNARNRRQGAISASTSAANSTTPTNVSNSSRMRSRRPGHQTTHPNRVAVDRGTSESQLNSSSVAVQAPEVASNESTREASDQNTEHRGDDDTTTASSDMTESSSNMTENTPPSSSNAPIIATSTTASPEAISNDIGSGSPQDVSNEPSASPTTPILAPTPPQQSLKRALEFSPLSPITPPTTDIYELVAREREVWMGLEEGKEAKKRRRDRSVL